MSESYLEYWSKVLTGEQAEMPKTKSAELTADEKNLKLQISLLQSRVKDLESRQRDALKEMAESLCSFMDKYKVQFEEVIKSQENKIIDSPSMLMFVDLTDRVKCIEEQIKEEISDSLVDLSFS